MPESSKPPTPGEPAEDENKRPTVVPPFDVHELARRSRAAEPSGRPAMRPQTVTLVDEVELEAARLASMHRSSLPPFLASGAARERPGEDPVLEVVSTPQVGNDPLDDARVLFDAGDEAGALSIVEDLLLRTPSHAPARALAEECERALTNRYTADIGPLDQVPLLAVSIDKLVSLALDHRAGFVISFVDGVSTLAAIVDMSSMAPSEILRTFIELRDRGIISLP